MLNIQGVKTINVSANLASLFAEKQSWSTVPNGTSFTMLFARLSQRAGGYQDKDFIVAEGVYIPADVTTIEEAISKAVPVQMYTNTVINNRVEDRSMRVGKVYTITKAFSKGDVVNGKAMAYHGFDMSVLESEELERGLAEIWNTTQMDKINPEMRFTVTKDEIGNTRVFESIAGETPHDNAPAVAQPAVAQPAVAQPAGGIAIPTINFG